MYGLAFSGVYESLYNEYVDYAECFSEYMSSIALLLLKRPMYCPIIHLREVMELPLIGEFDISSPGAKARISRIHNANFMHACIKLPGIYRFLVKYLKRFNASMSVDELIQSSSKKISLISQIIYNKLRFRAFFVDGFGQVSW